MARYPSIITKSRSDLTVARAAMANHPSWRPGTKALVDFCDTFGANPLPDGAIANPAVMSDLLEPPKTVTLGAPGLTSAPGKAGIVSTGGAGNIQIGGAGDCSIPVDHSFLFSIWLKHPAVGFNATPYLPVAWVGTASPLNGNTCQLYMDSGADGKSYRMQVGTGTAVRSQSFASGAAQGAPTLLSQHFDPITGRLQIYRNGVLVSGPVTGALNLPDGSSMVLRVNTQFIGTIYGLSLIDVTEALATEALQGETSITVAQHLLAEYQFGMGTLAAAPRAAYA